MVGLMGEIHKDDTNLVSKNQTISVVTFRGKLVL